MGSPRRPGKKAAAGPAQDAAKERARSLFARLRALHPDAHCELDHDGPFQLLCATVMSAQTTDVAVNKVTPALFAAFPDAPRLAAADPERDVAPKIASIGMYRQKARNLVGLAKILVDEHGGEVPASLDALVALPGVGRKTANVVLGVAFGAPEGVVVDTHVQRLAQRLGFTTAEEPVAIERDLVALFPKDAWDPLSHTLIFHGRRVCDAQRPACTRPEGCPLMAPQGDAPPCPSAGPGAITIGRKKPAGRSATKTAKKTAKKTAAKKTATKVAAKKVAAKKTAKKAAAKKAATRKAPR